MQTRNRLDVYKRQIWGRVTQNRSQGRATWYFADEFHLLLKEEQTAAYSAEIWKRFRKWGGVPTGATQNVKDLLSCLLYTSHSGRSHPLFSGAGRFQAAKP